MTELIKLHDYPPHASSVVDEVLEGLRKAQKELPSKFFYDHRGSELFDEITHLDEYYIPNAENQIMERHIDDIVGLMGPRTMLIEYGSGTSKKTRLLLDHLESLSAYVPVDISKEQLLSSAQVIAREYPDVEVMPVRADYNDEFLLPQARRPVDRRVVYYPGSTIGNFHHQQAVKFLQRIARIDGPGGGLLIGVDLQKDPATLHRAYNDDQGVTARFNLNLLERLNRDIATDFDVSKFKHRAIYDQDLGRIEMHLVSLVDQAVTVGDEVIEFAAGESIWTESSYKFTLQSFANLAKASGFDVQRVWLDEAKLFSVHYLTVA